MAKAKKQVLSLDERLEQALVPEGEQPYPVPENWVFSYFTSLIDVQGGTQPPKSTFVNQPQEGYVRLVQIRDFASEKYKVYIPDKKNLRKFDDSDILIARYGASLGRICTGLSGAYNVALAKTIFSRQALFPRFVYWLLQSECFQIPLMQLSRTAQAGFNKDDLSYFAIPIPPLAEQQRIVRQIESLFQKLDSARDLVQNALDSFETRKAAILHKAFTGQLTQKWRNKKHLNFESWEKVLLKDVCEPISCGGTPTGRIVATGCIPFLKVYNIVNNKIDFSYKPQFIDEEIHSTRLKKSILKPYDVIMNIVGPPLRKIAVIPDYYPEWNMNQAIVRFRPLKKLDYRYLYYCLCYPATLDDVIKDTKGVVGQANISITQSRNLSIPLPLLCEQQEIVRILDNLLENEQKAKDLCNILDQIDLMKKAILARAFRGELGTNDPSEESAMGLLKDVLAKAENK